MKYDRDPGILIVVRGYTLRMLFVRPGVIHLFSFARSGIRGHERRMFCRKGIISTSSTLKRGSASRSTYPELRYDSFTDKRVRS